MIKTQNLTIGYEGNVLHRNLNILLQRGTLTCLLGSNGAGKSTLLRTLCGLEKPLEGEIWIEGEAVPQLSPVRMSQMVGLVLTDREVMGGLTVRELVEMGRYPYTGFFGRLSAVDHDKVEQAMAITGVASMASRYLSQLSDGERQKAMIARLLAQECPCLILDEPTAFLDLNARVEIMDLLHRLALETHKAVLLSTHDMDTAFQYADELWLLSPKFGFKQGFPEDLICSGEFVEYFAHAHISFDIANGQFRRNAENAPIVKIEAPEKWHRWLKNIVYRCGFSVDLVADVHILMESPYKITVFLSPTKKCIFRSLKELAEWLKNERQKNKKTEKKSSKSL